MTWLRISNGVWAILCWFSNLDQKMKNLSRGNIVLNASIGAYREMPIKCCKVLALIIMQSSFYSLSFGRWQRHDLAKGIFFSCIYLFHPIYTQKEILQMGKQCFLSRLYFYSYFTWSRVNINPVLTVISGMQVHRQTCHCDHSPLCESSMCWNGCGMPVRKSSDNLFHELTETQWSTADLCSVTSSVMHRETHINTFCVKAWRDQWSTWSGQEGIWVSLNKQHQTIRGLQTSPFYFLPKPQKIFQDENMRHSFS